MCGGCNKHYITAAASIPTINAKEWRWNGSSPRNCHNLRVSQNPKSLLKTAPHLQMLKPPLSIFFFFVMLSVPTIFNTIFPGSRGPGSKQAGGDQEFVWWTCLLPRALWSNPRNWWTRGTARSVYLGQKNQGAGLSRHPGEGKGLSLLYVVQRH